MLFSPRPSLFSHMKQRLLSYIINGGTLRAYLCVLGLLFARRLNKQRSSALIPQSVLPWAPRDGRTVLVFPQAPSLRRNFRSGSSAGLVFSSCARRLDSSRVLQSFSQSGRSLDAQLL